MKHKTKRILTLLMTVVMVIALPVIGASAADLTFEDSAPYKCTNTTDLQIYIGPNTDTSGYFADIKTVAVTVDLYKVADAVHEAAGENHGSMYVFSPTSSVSEFNDILSKTAKYDDLVTLNNTDWQTMAQSLAGKMFSESGVSVPSGVSKVSLDAPAGAGITTKQSVGAGLYLAIAHGTALGDDYVVMDGTNVKTKAQSDHYVYYYTPELIALPTTAATMGVSVKNPTDTQPAGTYNNPLPSTAGGQWQTEVTALLKPTRTYRMGKLVVQKNLPAIEEHSDATFIFHVTGMYDYGGPGVTLDKPIKVYDNDLTISFNTQDGGGILAYKDPTTGYYYIELPVGTKVNVEEIYPGSCYKQDGPTAYSIADQRIPVPVTDDTALTVTTKNIYNGNIITGYGIQNTFQWNGSKWIHYVTDPATSGGGSK